MINLYIYIVAHYKLSTPCWTAYLKRSLNMTGSIVYMIAKAVTKITTANHFVNAPYVLRKRISERIAITVGPTILLTLPLFCKPHISQLEVGRIS